MKILFSQESMDPSGLVSMVHAAVGGVMCGGYFLGIFCLDGFLTLPEY